MNVSRDSLLEIARMHWCSPQDFEKRVMERALSKKTLIVPSLIGCKDFKSLRIKIVDVKERSVLLSWVNNMPDRFQEAKSKCGKAQFIFGFEPYDLEDKCSLGILVS